MKLFGLSLGGEAVPAGAEHFVSEASMAEGRKQHGLSEKGFSHHREGDEALTEERQQLQALLEVLNSGHQEHY